MAESKFKSGDLIIVVDSDDCSMYYSDGYVGRVITEGKYIDFNNELNKDHPEEFGDGFAYASDYQLKQYTPIEDLPLWKANHMYLDEEQQQALRKLLLRVQWDEKYAAKIKLNSLSIPSFTNAFVWEYAEEGQSYWSIINNQCEDQELQRPNKDEEQSNQNGGSSDYYKLAITRVSDGETFDCEMGDIIYSVFGGDFDLGNIVKACRRSYLATIGQGKQGAPIDYDMNKIAWFCEDFANRKG